MRNTMTLVTIMLLALMTVAACDTVDEADVSPTAAPLEEATVAPPPTESYPAPEMTEAYPPPPPTPDLGYPDDQVWVVAPAGEQCEEPQYETAEDVTSSLEADGVEVFAVEEEGRVVCEACGCPTSLHFRARIAIEDLSQAQSLGWLRE
ncbi:MAG: hypothetical protein R3300_22065 [Candidatus Promineifilaceae bacterium]|nr:hypothetical protein [Candidatus Promineifilaceae bacterium]